MTVENDSVVLRDCGAYDPNKMSSLHAQMKRLTVSTLIGCFALVVSACFLLNMPPVAVFVASTTSGAAPLAVIFDGSGSADSDGEIASYRWTFGDGEAGLGDVRTHTYMLPGTYVVHLTVTDDDGATAKAAALTITVSEGVPSSTGPALGPNSAPVARFAASPTTGTAPLTVDFDASGSVDSDGVITSYAWTFGDGGESSGVAASRTYTSAGTYTARLTITDDAGATGTVSRTVVVSAPSAATSGNGAPVAQFVASPTSGAAPLTVDFDATSSSDADGAVISFAWDFGDGGRASGSTANHTYNGAGTYSVLLTVTDDDGAKDTTTRTIQVSAAAAPAPAGNSAPVASFVASPTSGTAPLDIGVDASGSSDSDGTIMDYAWSYGDGGTGNGVTALHTYNSSGTYTVQLTVTDDDGATDTATRTIDVTDATPAANEPPVAGFYSSKQSGEPPLDVDFYAWYSSDPDGQIVAYAWDFGDGTTSSGHTTSHTYNEFGTYTVILTVTDDDGATDDAVQQIRIDLGGC